jgi:hypothetical protein
MKRKMHQLNPPLRYSIYAVWGRENKKKDEEDIKVHLSPLERLDGR